MRIDDNVTLACLSENLGELHHMKAFRVNDIFENTAGSHTRKLIDIPYQDQSGSRNDRF